MSTSPASKGASTMAKSLVMTDAQEIMWSLTSSACRPDFSSVDSASSWQYGKRIVTFTGMTCVVCTAIVIAVVVAAASLLHLSSKENNSSLPSNVYIIPNPQHFADRPLTVVLHRRNVQKLKSQIEQMYLLLKTYYEKQNAIANTKICECSSPSELFSCNFPLDSINKNCSLLNRFGYESGNPCIALVLHLTSDWKPEPFATSKLPLMIGTEYDPNLVYLACSTNLDCGSNISYSPFHGFPTCYFSSESAKKHLPPLVMLQFSGMPFDIEVEVQCQFLAKNVDDEDRSKVFKELRFNLIII